MEQGIEELGRLVEIGRQLQHAELFLWVSLILYGLGIGLRCLVILAIDFPYTVVATRSKLMFWVIFNSIMGLWCLYALGFSLNR